MLEASTISSKTPCCNTAQADRIVLPVNPKPDSNPLNTSGSTVLLGVG